MLGALLTCYHVSNVRRCDAITYASKARESLGTMIGRVALTQPDFHCSISSAGLTLALDVWVRGTSQLCC